MFDLGHGTYNSIIHLDKNNYSRKLTSEGFETINAIKDVHGDCLVGTSGKLYPVVELKHKLLELKCSRWTVTLDMCRNETSSRGVNVQRKAHNQSIRKVELR